MLKSVIIIIDTEFLEILHSFVLLVSHMQSYIYLHSFMYYVC
jgi:hypothetical protein